MSALRCPTHLLVFHLVVLALASPTLAQYGADVEVRLIQVPVVVTHKGKAVENLTKEDFDVFINGERQPIAYFDVVDFSNDELASPGKAQKPPSQRRLTLLVFDVVNSSYTNLKRVRSEVQTFINGLAPDDLVAVAVYTGGGQARYIVPFTRDRQTVIRAATTLKRSKAGDALALTMTPAERAVFMQPQSISPPTGPVEENYSEDLITGMDDFETTVSAMSGGEAAIPSMLDALRSTKQLQNESAAEAWARALGDLAEDMKPLEGIKQVLLLTEGVLVEDTRAILFTNVARNMHERFKSSGATLNVLDIGGLRAPGGDAGYRTLGAPAIAPDILFTAALGTGGRVLSGSGVLNSLRLFVESRSVTYLLGLNPPERERDENEVVVKVKNQRAFTEVSYPRGYARSDAGRKVSGLVLADAMLNDIRRDDITVRLRLNPAGETVIADVGMPSNELLTHAFGGLLIVDVFVYIFDHAGDVKGWKHRRMRLEEAKARELLKGAELVRRERFSLKPGRYTLKALVHIDGSDLLGFRRMDFEVPAAGGT